MPLCLGHLRLSRAIHFGFSTCLHDWSSCRFPLNALARSRESEPLCEPHHSRAGSKPRPPLITRVRRADLAIARRVPPGPLFAKNRLDLDGSILLCLASSIACRTRCRMSSRRAALHRAGAPSATCKPIPRTDSSKPSVCKSRYARATVFGFTTSCFESSRTDGTRSPGTHASRNRELHPVRNLTVDRPIISEFRSSKIIAPGSLSVLATQYSIRRKGWASSHAQGIRGIISWRGRTWGDGRGDGMSHGFTHPDRERASRSLASPITSIGLVPGAHRQPADDRDFLRLGLVVEFLAGLDDLAGRGMPDVQG